MKKTLADLTEVEMLKLKLAMEHLKHCALIYGTKPDDFERQTLLLSAAREFSETCRDIGFEEHWREQFVGVRSCTS